MPDDQKPVDVWMLTTHLPPGRSLLDIIGVTQRPDETTIEAAKRGVADLRRAAIAEEREAFAIYLETIGCWHSPKDADEFRALAPDQPIPGWKT